MKLTVVFGDQPSVLEELMHTGIERPIARRVVQIELTSEQARQLECRVLWSSPKGVLKETREVVALEDSEPERKENEGV